MLSKMEDAIECAEGRKRVEDGRRYQGEKVIAELQTTRARFYSQSGDKGSVTPL